MPYVEIFHKLLPEKKSVLNMRNLIKLFAKIKKQRDFCLVSEWLLVITIYDATTG
jgi:hypothetical protein